MSGKNIGINLLLPESRLDPKGRPCPSSYFSQDFLLFRPQTFFFAFFLSLSTKQFPNPHLSIGREEKFFLSFFVAKGKFVLGALFPPSRSLPCLQVQFCCQTKTKNSSNFLDCRLDSITPVRRVNFFSSPKVLGCAEKKGRSRDENALSRTLKN